MIMRVSVDKPLPEGWGAAVAAVDWNEHWLVSNIDIRGRNQRWYGLFSGVSVNGISVPCLCLLNYPVVKVLSIRYLRLLSL